MSDLADETVIAIQVTSHEHLLEAIVAAMPLGQPILDPVLTIHMEPCGQRVTFPTISDIPDVNVKCPCGDNNHWLIRYDRR